MPFNPSAVATKIRGSQLILHWQPPLCLLRQPGSLGSIPAIGVYIHTVFSPSWRKGVEKMVKALANRKSRRQLICHKNEKVHPSNPRANIEVRGVGKMFTALSS